MRSANITTMALSKGNFEMIESQEQRDFLCQFLGDKPETVIWIHSLKLGRCNALVTREQGQFKSVVLQAHDITEEPTGFGTDTNSIWELLRLVNGWNCMLVDKDLAIELGKTIQNNLGVRTRLLDDINYILPSPTRNYTCKEVRTFTIEDKALLERAPPELRGGLWGDTNNLLTNSIVAGAIVDNKVVATAIMTATSQSYSDIGIYTLPDFRGRGFATSCASIVARNIQNLGKTPVWSTGEHNTASKKIAQKLGFIEVLTRAYIVLESAPNFVNSRDLY